MASLGIPLLRKDSVGSCAPHLMPFHVNYSGSSEGLDIYFRPQPCPSPTFGAAPPPAFFESQDTVVASDSQLDASVASNPSSLTLNNDSPAAEVPPNKRFVAAFRGRTIHGLEIPVPEGYTGALLRSSSSSASQATQPTAHQNGRRARRGKQTAIEVDEEEEDSDMNANIDDEQPLRTLTPVFGFETFTLWHPDNAVDASRDEYFRALTEWTRIGSVLHDYEE